MSASLQTAAAAPEVLEAFQDVLRAESSQEELRGVFTSLLLFHSHQSRASVRNGRPLLAMSYGDAERVLRIVTQMERFFPPARRHIAQNILDDDRTHLLRNGIVRLVDNIFDLPAWFAAVMAMQYLNCYAATDESSDKRLSAIARTVYADWPRDIDFEGSLNPRPDLPLDLHDRTECLYHHLEDTLLPLWQDLSDCVWVSAAMRTIARHVYAALVKLKKDFGTWLYGRN